jgi:hypothetical protein
LFREGEAPPAAPAKSEQDDLARQWIVLHLFHPNRTGPFQMAHAAQRDRLRQRGKAMEFAQSHFPVRLPCTTQRLDHAMALLWRGFARLGAWRRGSGRTGQAAANMPPECEEHESDPCLAPPGPLLARAAPSLRLRIRCINGALTLRGPWRLG